MVRKSSPAKTEARNFLGGIQQVLLEAAHVVSGGHPRERGTNNVQHVPAQRRFKLPKTGERGTNSNVQHVPAQRRFKLPKKEARRVSDPPAPVRELAMKSERRNPNDGTVTRQLLSSSSMDRSVSTVTLDTALTPTPLASSTNQQRQDTSTSREQLNETSTHRVCELLAGSPYLKLPSRSDAGMSSIHQSTKNSRSKSMTNSTQHSLSVSFSIPNEPILSSSNTCTSLHPSRPTSNTASSRTIKDSSVNVNMPLSLNDGDSSYTRATRSSISGTSKDVKDDDSASSSRGETQVVKEKDSNSWLSLILEVESANVLKTDDTLFANPSESMDSSDDDDASCVSLSSRDSYIEPGQYDLKSLSVENKILADLIRFYYQK
jgi:hypothetical protein